MEEDPLSGLDTLEARAEGERWELKLAPSKETFSISACAIGKQEVEITPEVLHRLLQAFLCVANIKLLFASS